MNAGFLSYKKAGCLIAAILLMISLTEGKSQVISGEKTSIKIRESAARDTKVSTTSYLDYNVVFKDRNGNGILEADESGFLEVEIVNNSLRTAYDVRVTCSEPEKQIKGLQISPMVAAGDIMAKEVKKVNLAISADNQIGNNDIKLTINVGDRSGAKAASSEVIIRSRPTAVSFTAEWLSPEINDTSVFDQLMVIKLHIRSSSVVKNVVLLNNDTVQVINYSLTKNDPYYSLTYFQRLEPGNNAIEVRFDNEDNQHLAVTRNIFYVNEKRLALIIGNADYTFGSLSNPVNDVRAMEEILRKVGFEVMKYENLTQKDLKKAIDNFGAKLSGYDVGLFYYAGHGIQANGFNYLIPVDAQLENYEDVDYDCVQADRVLGKMEYAATKVNIIILDACRNNPFERQWSRSASGKGLAFMDAPSGSLIAYATSPGRTAADGSGRNGLYTSMLLKYIQQKGLQIEEVFKNVRRDVETQSGGSQIPWESTSLKGQFYFRR
jgi:Caspase domain